MPHGSWAGALSYPLPRTRNLRTELPQFNSELHELQSVSLSDDALPDGRRYHP